MGQQGHDDGPEEANAVLVQVGPQGFPHALDFLLLGQQFIQGEQDLDPAAAGARRTAGARCTPRLEQWLWHCELNLLFVTELSFTIVIELSSYICRAAPKVRQDRSPVAGAASPEGGRGAQAPLFYMRHRKDWDRTSAVTR